MLLKTAVILALGLIGWALCGAIMGLGLAYSTEATAITVHAVGAPLVFAVIAWIYFRAFAYTTPLQTAVIFIAIALFMDFFVVAPFIEKSFAMFASITGLWLPMALIFVATVLVGWVATRQTAVNP